MKRNENVNFVYYFLLFAECFCWGSITEDLSLFLNLSFHTGPGGFNSCINLRISQYLRENLYRLPSQLHKDPEQEQHNRYLNFWAGACLAPGQHPDDLQSHPSETRIDSGRGWCLCVGGVGREEGGGLWWDWWYPSSVYLLNFLWSCFGNRYSHRREDVGAGRK